MRVDLLVVVVVVVATQHCNVWSLVVVLICVTIVNETRFVTEIFYYTGHGDQLINVDDDEEEPLGDSVPVEAFLFCSCGRICKEKKCG